MNLRVYLTEERRAFPDEHWLLDNGAGELAFKHPGELIRAFSRHFAALGINTDAKVIHGFRAKYISSLWESGVDLQTVQELAGHSSPLITAVYTTDPGLNTGTRGGGPFLGPQKCAFRQGLWPTLLHLPRD